MQSFNFKEEVKEVIIDLTHSHIWDVTSVAMLDSAVEKFQKNGIQVTVRGLNEASSIMIDKYGTCKNLKRSFGTFSIIENYIFIKEIYITSGLGYLKGFTTLLLA